MNDDVGFVLDIYA